MKLTKTKLKEMIKQELQEISGTGGGQKEIERIKKADADLTKVKKTRHVKSRAYDTYNRAAKATATTLATADATVTKATSAYNTAVAAKNRLASQKYRKADRSARDGYVYSLRQNDRSYTLNPAWTTADNDVSAKNLLRNTATLDATAARNANTTAQAKKATSLADYETALQQLTKAQKTRKAVKTQTGFGFGAGAGGRAGGKGGTAKTAGEIGTGEKGGEEEDKNESIFKILGRDLMNEIDNLKKYKK